MEIKLNKVIKVIVDVKGINDADFDYRQELQEIEDARLEKMMVQELGASHESFEAELASYDLDAEFDYVY